MDSRSGSQADPRGLRAGKRHKAALQKNEIQASLQESTRQQPTPDTLTEKDFTGVITLGKSFGLASSLTASSGRKTSLGICPSDMDFFQYERTGL